MYVKYVNDCKWTYISYMAHPVNMLATPYSWRATCFTLRRCSAFLLPKTRSAATLQRVSPSSAMRMAEYCSHSYWLIPKTDARCKAAMIMQYFENFECSLATNPLASPLPRKRPTKIVWCVKDMLPFLFSIRCTRNTSQTPPSTHPTSCSPVGSLPCCCPQHRS